MFNCIGLPASALSRFTAMPRLESLFHILCVLANHIGVSIPLRLLSVCNLQCCPYVSQSRFNALGRPRKRALHGSVGRRGSGWGICIRSRLSDCRRSASYAENDRNQRRTEKPIHIYLQCSWQDDQLIRKVRLANSHDQRSNRLFPDAVAAPIAEEKARDSFVPGLIVQGKGGEKNTLNEVLLSPGPGNVLLMQIKTMETCHPGAQIRLNDTPMASSDAVCQCEYQSSRSPAGVAQCGDR